MKDQQTEPNTQNETPASKGGIILVGLFILAFIAWIVSKIFPQEEQKKYKAQLANEYGVSTKVLMHWLKTLASEEFKAQYVQTKKKLLPVGSVSYYLGKPEDRPLDLNNQPVKTKTDLARVLFISNSTLSDRVKMIKDYEMEFRMKYEQYAQLRTLPPLQVKLIVRWMKNNEFDISRVKSDVCPNSRTRPES